MANMVVNAVVFGIFAVIMISLITWVAGWAYGKYQDAPAGTAVASDVVAMPNWLKAAVLAVGSAVAYMAYDYAGIKDKVDKM